MFIVDCTFLYCVNSINLHKGKFGKFIPYNVFIILIFVLSWTGYASSDYFNYIHVLSELKTYLVTPNIEYVYSAIAYFVNYENIAFRAVIFTTIYICVFYIFRNYSKNKNLSLSIFFILFFSSVTSVIRSSLCDAIFYICILPFLYKKTSLRLILAIAGGVAAFFFHKSAFILYIPFILCLLRFNRKYYKMLVYCLPIIIMVSFIATTFVFDNFFAESVYREEAMGDSSRSAQIIRAVWIVLWSIIIYVSYSNIINKIKLNNFTGYIFRMAFWFEYIAFILMWNPASPYLYQRVLLHGYVPIVLMLTIILSKKSLNTNKIILIAMGLSILQNQTAFYLLNAYFNKLVANDLYIK